MRRPTVPRKRNRADLDKPAACQLENINIWTGARTPCPGKADHLLLAGRSVIGLCCGHRLVIGGALPAGWVIL